MLDSIELFEYGRSHKSISVMGDEVIAVHCWIYFSQSVRSCQIVEGQKALLFGTIRTDRME